MSVSRACGEPLARYSCHAASTASGRTALPADWNGQRDAVRGGMVGSSVVGHQARQCGDRPGGLRVGVDASEWLLSHDRLADGLVARDDGGQRRREAQEALGQPAETRVSIARLGLALGLGYDDLVAAPCV